MSGSSRSNKYRVCSTPAEGDRVPDQEQNKRRRAEGNVLTTGTTKPGPMMTRRRSGGANVNAGFGIQENRAGESGRQAASLARRSRAGSSGRTP
jgi:hypothetical protein